MYQKIYNNRQLHHVYLRLCFHSLESLLLRFFIFFLRSFNRIMWRNGSRQVGRITYVLVRKNISLGSQTQICSALYNTHCMLFLHYSSWWPFLGLLSSVLNYVTNFTVILWLITASMMTTAGIQHKLHLLIFRNGNFWQADSSDKKKKQDSFPWYSSSSFCSQKMTELMRMIIRSEMHPACITTFCWKSTTFLKSARIAHGTNVGTMFVLGCIRCTLPALSFIFVRSHYYICFILVGSLGKIFSTVFSATFNIIQENTRYSVSCWIYFFTAPSPKSPPIFVGLVSSHWSVSSS